MPKQTPEKVEVTIDDITVHIDADIGDDLELLEAIVIADNTDGRYSVPEANYATVRALQIVFGEDYKTVKDALRDERGRVSTSAAISLFYRVLGDVAKNSAPSQA